MADQTNDLLMRVVGKKAPMAADSLTNFMVGTDQDTLRDGFVAGYFCELIDFSFSAGVEASLSKGNKEKKEQEELLKKMQAMNQQPGDDKDKKPEPKWKKSRDLQALELVQQQRRRAEKRTDSEAVDMQPVEYTRLVDSSSTLLMQALAGSETLPEISIVKRKATGDGNSGLCYLRLDFKNVLFTRLELKDEQHVMHESGTFIYRDLLIRYRPQLPSGNLGAAISATWTMPKANK